MPQIWVIFIILSIVMNIVSKSKKQSAAKQGNQPPQQVQPPVNRQKNAPRQNAPQKPAGTPKPLAQAMQAKPLPTHTAKPLEAHMHTPAMGVEGVGTEGEDCCHEYMLEDRGAVSPEAPAPADAQKALEAQALLQGVIFSEILGRRPVRAYGRKQA